MPYIDPKKRPKMDEIVRLIGELDILGDKITSKEKIENIIQKMIEFDVKVNGDLNYILYAVCKRYVKPSYNNYKKYLTKFLYQNSNFSSNGDLVDVLSGFYHNYAYDYEDENERSTNLVGELDCCAKEIYRRLIAPYEDTKIAENGDVE